MEDSRVQRAKSSLEETMDKLRRFQAYSTIVQVENEISMAIMDYSQKEMSNLEATMVELRRVQIELAKYRAQFMEDVHRAPKEESKFKNGVD